MTDIDMAVSIFLGSCIWAWAAGAISTMFSCAISDTPRPEKISWFDIVFFILNVAAFNVVFWA